MGVLESRSKRLSLIHRRPKLYILCPEAVVHQQRAARARALAPRAATAARAAAADHFLTAWD
jgi:ribosomal protein L36